MEAAELGIFMISASVFAVVLAHPSSPVRMWIEGETSRRLVAGVLMGATAIALVRSPWGRRSGAHMNPALTLAFLRLGKIAPVDALFYVLAQFAGGLAGIVAAAVLVGPSLASPGVSYATTRPGPPGPYVAFLAELAISFVLMLAVLILSNAARLARLTPFVVGALIAVYITIEEPLSGMSMNPARTFGPAVFAQVWDAVWVYFTAPPLGMLLAAEAFVRSRGREAVWCAKLHHGTDQGCIFNCAHPAL